MATHIGNDGQVKIGANAVAEIVSFSLSESVNTADDSVLGDTSTSHIAGMKSWSGSVSCYWDETNTTGQGAMTAGASVTLNLYPEGSTSGDTYWTGTATITGIERSVSNDTIVQANFTFTGNGALTSTTVV